MSIAGELARFVTSTNADIDSSRIIRELARERGGAEQATLWFDGGRRLAVSRLARSARVTRG